MAAPCGRILVLVALGALLVAPAVSAECCRGKEMEDGSVCHDRDAKTLQACQSDARCMWTDQCVRVCRVAPATPGVLVFTVPRSLRPRMQGLRNQDLRTAADMSFTLLYWLAGVCFALCCEKGRRWAMGMEGFWPAGRTRNGRFR